MCLSFESAPENGLKRNQTTKYGANPKEKYLFIYLLTKNYHKKKHTTENLPQSISIVGHGKFLVGHGNFSVGHGIFSVTWSGHMVYGQSYTPHNLNKSAQAYKNLPQPTNSVKTQTL